MKTPGIYTNINTQTQRTGLPTQDHHIVFVTGDTAAPANPTPIYDTATANVVSGANSNAGRMMGAALSVSQGVGVEVVGKSDPSGPSDGSGGDSAIINSNLIFSVESYNNPTNSYRLYVYFDAPQGDWEITESGVVVADSTGFTAEWVDLVFDGSGGADIYFNISTPDIKQFESNVTASYVGIYYNGDYTAERESPLGEIIIKQFSSKIPEFSTQVFSTLLQVPQTIPPELVDINRLFIDAYLFNQDISMWDVSNVVNMNRMLESAKTFNQDLSEWCVPNITSLPENFDLNTPQWTLPKPVWGTCPRGENITTT